MHTITKPRGHGRQWTPEETDELRRRCEAGELLPDIARAMGRTQEACRTRANEMRIPCRSTARRSPSSPAKPAR